MSIPHIKYPILLAPRLLIWDNRDIWFTNKHHRRKWLAWTRGLRLDYPSFTLEEIYQCAAHIGMDGIRIEKEPRQETNM